MPMRPNRLEVEGFTAFRERTVVEFDGADLFAFTGPTGSGKSSLVDAMGFALYGRIHRYGEKLVHAAISQGRNEARVRLDFSAGGAPYTAGRGGRRGGGRGGPPPKGPLGGGGGGGGGGAEGGGGGPRAAWWGGF